ncbi:hypothetical protein VIBAE_B10001 [Vibrio aestuarianus subsp. francensis]|nr:hypothetical protein VIBAE_B10001 [Vibrio aestuarianus subsp. francensis]
MTRRILDSVRSYRSSLTERFVIVSFNGSKFNFYKIQIALRLFMLLVFGSLDVVTLKVPVSVMVLSLSIISSMKIVSAIC